jgi:hypothetical protein
MEVFESMLVGSEIDAHGAKWYRIKHLRDDLENGLRLYLAAKIGDPLPAATYVVGEEIDEAELEKLRAVEAKHQADLAAIRSRSK